MTHSSQRPPPDDLDGFPTRPVGGDTVWRVVHDEYTQRPWWFRSLPPPDDESPGRFDLPAPRGTCYWADRRIAAVAEKLVRDAEAGALVPSTLVAGRSAVSTRAPDADLADLTVADAARFGVTVELSVSLPPYDTCHQWAESLNTVADGIWYETRHYPSGRSAAFFGAAGDDQPTEPDPANTVPLTTMQEEIEDELGVRIEDPPSLSEILP